MDDDSLHVLLSRGRLSGPQRDRIFERAFNGSRGARHWGRRAAYTAAALLPVAAAVALLLRPGPEASDGGPAGWLAAKGLPGTPALGARCPERAPGSCRKGDRLIFEVTGAAGGGFLAAYADCDARERIWYFPTQNAGMAVVPPAEGHSVLQRAARIGEEHGAGRCVVHLALLDHPVERADVLAGDNAGVTADVTIVVSP
jgi:hypothetical protein